MMALITLKCKMCGGDIQIIGDATVATCEYCGSIMAIPKVDDERIANLYNRANHLRMKKEFDKAQMIYETIVQERPRDAEAYWGATLCRFGIEYVEDPYSHERKPTMHRMQLDSIMEDCNYQLALSHADVIARDLYQQEAALIDRIQKRYLTIAGREEPFDVFICYKETGADQQRAKDSVYAQEIYEELTERGLKVFFARITLEDRLGEAYEPYIFAALHSARVMLVVGTCAEYMESDWVRNEWTRFLYLMKADNDKRIIPVYRDMNAYELPEEFAYLQAQDYGKIGAMQDLVRGVEKIVGERKTEQPMVTQAEIPSSNANADAFLRRAQLFMEDGQFAEAATYLNRALDTAPEFASAYMGKVQCALSLRHASDLGKAYFRIKLYSDWKKAKRFATPEEMVILQQYEAENEKHIEEMYHNYAYYEAIKLTERASYQFDGKYIDEYRKVLYDSEGAKRVIITESQLKTCETEISTRIERLDAGSGNPMMIQEAKKLFESLGDFRIAPKLAEGCDILAIAADHRDILIGRKRQYQAAKTPEQYDELVERAAQNIDSPGIPELIEDCKQRAEQLRNQSYGNLIEQMNSMQTGYGMTKVAEKFEEMGGYRDTEQKAAECRRLAETYQKQEEQALRKARIKRCCQAALICAMIAGAVIIAVIDFNQKYQNAERLMLTGHYDEASEAFADLGVRSPFNDAYKRMNEPYYVKAEHLLAAGEYEKASEAFAEAGDYSDAASRINEPYYVQAEELLAQREYGKTAKAFARAGDYGDAASRAGEYYYLYAEELLAKGAYWEAFYAFGSAGGHKDALTRKWRIGYEKLSHGKIAAFTTHSAGLKADGTAVAVGKEITFQHDVSNLTDSVAVSIGRYHAFGLKDDGTVEFTGQNQYKQCNTALWTNIVSISTDYKHTVGLRADGTVVAVGDNTKGQCEVTEWENMVAVAAGEEYTVGLKADGTAVAVGRNERGQCKVTNWTNIVEIAAGENHTVGLKADGTVVAVGYNYHEQCEVSEWTDIVTIAAGEEHTVGLKADGTVVAVGEDSQNRLDVSAWTDIVAIAAGSAHTLGLKTDGTVVAASSNDKNQCSVSDWVDIGGSRTLQ